MSATVPPELDGQSERPTLFDALAMSVVRSFGRTDPGRVRPSNEDQFLIAELARTMWVRQSSIPKPPTQHGRNRGHLFLVADGMGGHRAGEVASALGMATVESFVLHVLHRFSNLEVSDEQTVVKDFQAALLRADERICEESILHPEYSGMGTTLTLAFISGWKLFVLHAGDSRCYLLRGGRLLQLTQDHSVAAELARCGIITPEEATQHRLRHVVTNVLGGDHFGVHVDICQADLEPRDQLLLCTDGLYEKLPDEMMASVLINESEPDAACELLIAAANERGGHDNITAIVAHFDSPLLSTESRG